MIQLTLLPNASSLSNNDLSFSSFSSSSLVSRHQARLRGDFRFSSEFDDMDRRLAAGENSHLSLFLYFIIFYNFLCIFSGDVSVLVGPQSGNITHGDVDGVYNTALFYDPTGSSLSSDNSYLLVTDSGNHKIRKVVLSTKVVSTLVGPPQGTTVTSGTTNGVGTNVRFTEPVGIRLSPDNSFALVAEYGHKIRKIVISTLTVTTIAGGSTSGVTDGQGTSSKFNYPSDICISSDATFALITDTGSHRVRKLTISTGAVVGFVGSNVGSSGSSDGTGTNSRFNGPYGIALIPGGTYVLLTDTINKLIRKVVISTLVVTTLAGSTSSSGTGDGIGTNAKLYSPYGIDISSDSSYAMFVGGSYRLRKLTLSTNAVTSFAGQSLSGDVAGTGTNAMFNFPTSVCIFSDLGWFVVVDKISNKVKLVAALGKDLVLSFIFISYSSLISLISHLSS